MSFCDPIINYFCYFFFPPPYYYNDAGEIPDRPATVAGTERSEREDRCDATGTRTLSPSAATLMRRERPSLPLTSRGRLRISRGRSTSRGALISSAHRFCLAHVRSWPPVHESEREGISCEDLRLATDLGALPEEPSSGETGDSENAISTDFPARIPTRDEGENRSENTDAERLRVSLAERQNSPDKFFLWFGSFRPGLSDKDA